MTSGELTCARCDAGDIAAEVGYQPLYRELDAKPVFVVVHEYSREAIDALKLHARVIVGRGESKHDSVYVIPGLKATPVYTSTLKERMKPADLTCSLLRLWKLPELDHWYITTHGKSDKVVSPPAPPPEPGVRKRANGQPFSPMNQAAAARAGVPPEPSPMDEDMNAAMERAKARVEQKEKLNGKA